MKRCTGLRKLFHSTKFPHQEIRWNYGIFTQWQLSTFWQQCDLSIIQRVSENVFELKSLMNSYIYQDQNSVLEAWNRCSGEISKFQEKFNEFRKHGCEKSESFLYWDKFINELAPVLRDLTISFREGDWNLHLSSVYWAIPLCFAFDCVNYKLCYHFIPPRWNSPCRGEGAYPLRSSNQCINKWSSSERCGYVR